MGATLQALTASAGLLGSDAESAIQSYLATGPLVPGELDGLDRSERHAYLARHWGADGGRVAILVAQEVSA